MNLMAHGWYEGLLLVFNTMLDCFGLAVLAVILICAVALALHLCRPLLRRRSTVWFSGLLASAFMLVAGIAYGLHH